jgi:DNA invertase Pin-like site-specific DNA recombinase
MIILSGTEGVKMKKNYIYGYVKENVRQEDLIYQLNILKKYKCKEMITEKTSATKTERPELDRLKDKVKSGDTVVIESFSRLGRSTKDLLELIEYFVNNEVNLISIKENFDTSTSHGKIMLSTFQAFSQFERDLITQRTREGLINARARGRKGGRPMVKNNNVEKALELYNAKAYSISEIVEMSGISQATLYRYIKRAETQDNKPPVEVEKTAKIQMYLRVENNSKFVRGKKKAREDIETHLRYYYNMRKSTKSDSDYIFYVKYKTIDELKDEVYDILCELSNKADWRNCFIEDDTWCENPELSW